MSLTRDELRALQASELQRRVAELMDARRTGRAGALDDALAALVDFQAGTPFPDLQLEAARARDAASQEIAARALADLAAIVDRTAAAGAGFAAAARAADSGKKELVFPALAAASATSLELLRQFEATVRDIASSADQVHGLEDVPAAVKEAVAALEKLKKEIDRAAS